MTPWIPALALCLLCGCIVQGGAYAGHTTTTRDKPSQPTWGGQFQPRFVVKAPQGDWMLGAQFEGRTRNRDGSLAIWGLQLGRAVNFSKTVQAAPLLSFGTPLGWSERTNGFSLGVDLEVPIALNAARSLTEINREYRFIDLESALVPYIRLRGDNFTRGSEPRHASYEFAIGLAIRTRFVTDLIDL